MKRENQLTEYIVSGTLEVCVPIELPKGEKEFKALCTILLKDASSTREEIAKFLVLEAMLTGLDNMNYRQSEPSSVDDTNLEVEEVM